MLSSIVLMAVIIAVALTAQTLLLGDEVDSLSFDNPRVYVRPGIIGLMVGFANSTHLFKGAALWIGSSLSLIMMAGLFGYLIYWWHKEGSELKEMIWFIILAILSCLAMKSAAHALVDKTPAGAATKIIVALPTIYLVAAIGFFIADFFYVLYDESEGEGDEKLKGALTLAAAVLAAVLVIGLTGRALTISPGKAAKSAKTSVAEATTMADAETSGEAEATTVAKAEPRMDENMVDNTDYVSAGWAHYYNADIQDDGRAENDFNFGPNPWIDGGDAKYYHDNFAARRSEDPVLLAATMVALDCTLGTDFIGEVLYEGYDERLNMLEKADAAARVLDGDKELFNIANNAVNKLLNSRVSLKLKKMYDIDDQLFMNPATMSGVPGIVFYQANFDKGWCLVYEFRIKSGSNTKAQIVFHIPCGYQWADAAEKLDVAPEKAPESKSSSSSSSSSSKKKKKNSSNKGSKSETSISKITKVKKTKKTTRKTTTKTKTSKEKYDRPDGPEYDKDPSKAPKENTEPNDDPGPGPNTNSGGDKSTKDRDDNSTSKKDYDDYKKDMDELKEINDNQKKGGDSNEPSTKPKSSDTKVDNNGDKGTGNGSADTPTPTKEKAKEHSSGKEIKDKPGESWGGPSD